MRAAHDDQHVALYADLLGFEALIERHPEAIESSFDDERLVASGTSPSHHLYNRFFFRLVEEKLFRERLNGGYRAMLFSDCAFFVLGTPLRTALFAVELMRASVLEQIPLRMGIGSGTFNHLRNSTDEFDSAVVSRAMFTGTSITRAAKIEGHADHKGLRILIHPKTSQDALANLQARLKILPLEPASDGWEIDYLYERRPPSDISVADAMDIKLFDAVAEMNAPDLPQRARAHYVATFEALNRMRSLNGRAQLDLPAGWGG